MRHPRAMRPSIENTFPTDIHHSADLLSSPRASTDTDLADTPTSSSGNGSSVALLGHLTPPSPQDLESGVRDGSGVLGSDRLPPAKVCGKYYFVGAMHSLWLKLYGTTIVVRIEHAGPHDPESAILYLCQQAAHLVARLFP